MKQQFNLTILIILIYSLTACNNSGKVAHNKATSFVNTPLPGTNWTLIELMGKPVKDSNSKDIFLTLNADKKFAGNGGCNTFGGGYELLDSAHISFGPIISTKMYCDGAKYESLFFDIISKADNFYINADTLYLRNARLDSNAKFIANYHKNR